MTDTAFYRKKMPSRTSLAGGEEQCWVSKLQATGYLAGTVLEHCHCVKMPGRNQYAGEKTDCGLVSQGVSQHGVVGQKMLLALD